MLRTTLPISVICILWAVNGVTSQETVQAMRSPWLDPTDSTWMIMKAPDMNSFQSTATGLLRQRVGSIVYKDNLPLQNGSTTYAAILSDDHVGVAAGFNSQDIEPISLERFNQRIVENRQRSMLPVSACGYEQPDGSIIFETMWMPSTRLPERQLEYQVQFDSDNQTMTNYRNQGYLAVSVCSTKTLTGRAVTPSVVIIWHRMCQPPPVPLDPYAYEQIISVDVSEGDCLSANTRYQANLIFPIAMQMFNKGTDVRCSAIWQRLSDPSLRFELRVGAAPVNVANLNDKQMTPRQISVYRNAVGTEQMAVLWTNYETRNASFDGTFYGPNDDIPVNWLSGSTAGMKPEDKEKFETKVKSVLRAGQIPALSFALTRNEQLIRAVAIGYANPFAKEAATVTTKFRIGSVSKVLTAAAIFSLIDQGLISLNTPVFGPGGILGTEYGTQPYSEYLLKVRVVNLLEHTSGGWGVGTTNDMLFSFTSLNQSAFIGVEIDKYGPVFEPGTVFDYANFGYYLLGVIVGKVSGKPYEQYLKEKFWRPAGVPDQRVGIENRWFSERQPNEATFFVDVTGTMTDSYDLISPDRIASAGGWVASPSDWLRVTRLFNGFNCCTKDILSVNSITEMTRPSNASGGAVTRGLFIGNDYFGYGHTGYYPGGQANYMRKNSGVEVMVLHNKGTDTNDIASAVEAVTRLFMDLTPNWPQQDLFSTFMMN